MLVVDREVGNLSVGNRQDPPKSENGRGYKEPKEKLLIAPAHRVPPTRTEEDEPKGDEEKHFDIPGNRSTSHSESSNGRLPGRCSKKQHEQALKHAERHAATSVISGDRAHKDI